MYKLNIIIVVLCCVVLFATAQVPPPPNPNPIPAPAPVSKQGIPSGLGTIALVDFNNKTVSKYGESCKNSPNSVQLTCSEYHLLKCTKGICQCLSGRHIEKKEVYPGRITCGAAIGYSRCDLNEEYITRHYNQHLEDPTHPIKFNLKEAIQIDIESDRYTPKNLIRLFQIQHLIDSTNGAKVKLGVEQYIKFVRNSYCISFNCSTQGDCAGQSDEPPLEPNEPELKLSIGTVLNVLIPIYIITFVLSIYIH